MPQGLTLLSRAATGAELVFLQLDVRRLVAAEPGEVGGCGVEGAAPVAGAGGGVVDHGAALRAGGVDVEPGDLRAGAVGAADVGNVGALYLPAGGGA